MNNKQKTLYTEPKISMLDAANRAPVHVARDALLTEAITIMSVNDFSQLPVMNSDRTVHGMISWKSIGKRYGCHCNLVQDCMETTEEIAILDCGTPLIRAVQIISTKEFILVKGSDQRIVGLVTATDVTEQFTFLAEPFFLIGAIEENLRNLIQALPQELIVAALCSNDDKQNSHRKEENKFDVIDMSLGDHIRLLGRENIWNILKLYLSRKIFINQLDDVRKIRNHVMHFRGAPVSDKETGLLRHFLATLRNINPCITNNNNRGSK